MMVCGQQTPNSILVCVCVLPTFILHYFLKDFHLRGFQPVLGGGILLHTIPVAKLWHSTYAPLPLSLMLSVCSNVMMISFLVISFTPASTHRGELLSATSSACLWYTPCKGLLFHDGSTSFLYPFYIFLSWTQSPIWMWILCHIGFYTKVSLLKARFFFLLAVNHRRHAKAVICGSFQ